MSTLAVNTITNAAGGNTATINGMTPTADSLQGFRNRIINGNMRIDQRNAGASVTVTDAYTLDRWEVREDTDGAVTAQQIADAPAGFTNSARVTTTTADASLTGIQRLFFRQPIEGNNIADLAFGTASASAVTLSFWVKSSLTGTFGGAFTNNGSARSYPFTYAIAVANTWEYKTVTAPGDTSGTWLTNNGVGLSVVFGLGVGPDNSGTAGAWFSGARFSTTGAVSVIGTLNATWQITGVQLEAGAVATPFERRPYGTELALCQRYFETNTRGLAGGAGNDSTRVFAFSGNDFKATKRATPTVTVRSSQSNTAGQISGYSSGSERVVNDIATPTVDRLFTYLQVTASISSFEPQSYSWQASAEL